MLDDFRQPALVLPLAQGLQHVDRDEDFVRRVERPDHVLHPLEVHSGLAPDRGVDHRKQRGGNEGQPAPPHIEGGGESGDVTDDSPAEADDAAVPAEAFIEGEGDDPLKARKVLRLLPAVQDDSCGRKLAKEFVGVGVEDPQDRTAIVAQMRRQVFDILGKKNFGLGASGERDGHQCFHTPIYTLKARSLTTVNPSLEQSPSFQHNENHADHRVFRSCRHHLSQCKSP